MRRPTMRLDLKRNPYTTLIAIVLSASIILSLFTGSVIYVATATILCAMGYLYSLVLLHRLEGFRQALLEIPISKEERSELTFLFAVRSWMTLLIKLSRLRRKLGNERESVEHVIELTRIELRRPNLLKSFGEKLRMNNST